MVQMANSSVSSNEIRTAEEWAQEYLSHDYVPIPIPHKSKAPLLPGWPNFRPSLETLSSHFAGTVNIGLLCGGPSGGLVDIDLDCAEAIAIADALLPETGMVHSRQGRPRSHRWYQLSPGESTDTRKFEDPTEIGRSSKVLLEIRSTGAQTIVPPSLHPSGEELFWQPYNEPAEVKAEELERLAEMTAAASLIARKWVPGIRHKCALALSGALIRHNYELEQIIRIVEAICTAASDEEVQYRIRDTETTVANYFSQSQVTGLPTLANIIGDEACRRVSEWFHLDQAINVTTSRVTQVSCQSLPTAEAPAVPSSLAETDKAPIIDAELAYYGLAGEIVRLIEPHTEADPVAILVQLLAAFGNAVGCQPYFAVEADYHRMNLFVLVVGRSSKSRKGTSLGYVRRVFKMADPDWSERCIISGLASGEGLVWAVRDPVKAFRTKRGKDTSETEEVTEDFGVEDKRLLALQTEFATILKVISREGNTLSPTLRDAWDGRNLEIKTKNQPSRATAPHISVIGHITQDELVRSLTDTEASNGFANRFILVYAKRTKLLPLGGLDLESDLLALSGRLAEAIAFARAATKLRRDEEATNLWVEIYPKLSNDVPGLAGSLLARGEAQAIRLACIYALLDCSTVITTDHLKAALAVWNYAVSSVRYIFGNSLGFDASDHLLEVLRENPDGMTRTEIRDLFGRNRIATKVSKAIDFLLDHNMITKHTEQGTKGRPTERFFAL